MSSFKKILQINAQMEQNILTYGQKIEKVNTFDGFVHFLLVILRMGARTIQHPKLQNWRNTKRSVQILAYTHTT